MAIGVGTWVRVFADVPTLPYGVRRIGRVERVFWSTHRRQAAPQWRATVLFCKERRRRAGSEIVYSLPVTALQPAVPPDR